jgi:histidinol dehydrogenase
MRIVRDVVPSREGGPTGGDPLASRSAHVRQMLRDVHERGDQALVDLTAELDDVRLEPGDLRVPEDVVRGALEGLELAVLEGLRTAMRNVRTVVEAQLRDDPVSVELPEGQRVEVVEQPVARVGIYAPGGRAAYPSTVVMCAVTARAAGVPEIAVCSPPGGPLGEVHPIVLAACALCEVDEVYRVGGAQAIGALAYGTRSVPKVDVISGPGNYWVTEAKRLVVGHVGIDGVAGPSELVVVATGAADAELIALDLLAQAEHGQECFLALLSPDQQLLDAVVAQVERLARERPSVAEAELLVHRTPGVEEAVELAERLAPEHLELIGPEAEALVDRVRCAGAVFVGANAATAFGDYAAGSNHVLPTGGAARFQSSLSAATFRRRMARVSLPGEAAARLAPAGAALARAEGFPVHAESMERRA